MAWIIKSRTRKTANAVFLREIYRPDTIKPGERFPTAVSCRLAPWYERADIEPDRLYSEAEICN